MEPDDRYYWNGPLPETQAPATTPEPWTDTKVVGKPVVRGTRLSVDFLLGLMAQGWPEAEILRNYPGLEREDLLAYAGRVDFSALARK